jgi:hypothetical protein
MKADRLRQSKRARYFRSFRTAGIYLPKRLTLLLCAGCLALFSFFVIPPPQYKHLEPLFAKRPPEVGTPPAQEGNSARETRTIAVRVLGMEADGRVPEEADIERIRRIRLMQERVGTNIFIRSGYLESACFVTENTGPPPPEMRYELVLDRALSDCAALDPEEGEDEDKEASSLRGTATQLAISAVAVEKFHRNVLHRRLEWAYARAFSALFGRLPDVSLGPAQIRVSGVRQIAAEVGHASGPYAMLRTSDAELMQILSDECKSLKLAATMMYYFLTKAREIPACENESDPEECRNATAAATYVGQRRKTHAVIDYGPIVARMVRMVDILERGGEETQCEKKQ